MQLIYYEEIFIEIFLDKFRQVSYTIICKVILLNVKLFSFTLQVIFLLEKTIKIGLLFDYYGKLLTERQQEIISLYYFQDFSLGEIAERLEISRQGVYDHLQRGEKLLQNYEKDLKLVAKLNTFRNKLTEFEDYIASNDRINTEEKQDILGRIRMIKEDI